MSMNNVIPGSLLSHDMMQTLRIEELEEENRELRAKLDNRPKLSPRDVEMVRRLGATTGLSHQELADIFGVNRATISRTLNHTYHKDV